jgi:crotonobetainyl-CoA:carnitine CoA-transferase CaiB-like acyl-CoA transferase
MIEGGETGVKMPDSSNDTPWPGPLKGVKVLDFSRVLAGPFATQMLGDMGAEIIKIEAPDGGDDTRSIPPARDGVSHYFLSVNRNKKSIVVDLKDPKGREIILELVKSADIVVENFRPGVMERLGLGYHALAAINPGLIYCAISGFGLSGPLAPRPSFDIVVQALSGALSVNGEPGRAPTKLGIPLGDLVGGIYGPIAILGALHERNATGKGRLIDISLLDGLIGMLGYLAQLTFFLGTDPQPIGSEHPNLTPYGIFPAKDGSMVIACLTNIFWHRLCTALELPDALADERFASIEGRRDNRSEITALVSSRTKAKTCAELEDLFNHHEVPHAPVLGIKDALSQPQALARDMVVEVDHPVLGTIPIVGRSIKFPGTTPEPLSAPPTLGQHTDEVLRSLGHCDAGIAALRKSGTVA